jgi:hypothetical protein
LVGTASDAVTVARLGGDDPHVRSAYAVAAVQEEALDATRGDRDAADGTSRACGPAIALLFRQYFTLCFAGLP